MSDGLRTPVRVMSIDEMADRIEELEAENHLLKTSGIIEVSAHNNRVTEYMFHWEGRALDAEAKLAKAVEALLAAAPALENAANEIENLENVLSDYRQNWSEARAACYVCRTTLAELKG